MLLGPSKRDSLQKSENILSVQNLLERVHRGEYQELIDTIPHGTTNFDELVALICAFAFRGHVLQAKALWNVKKRGLSLSQKVHCLFHLMVATTRSSQFSEAIFYLKKMAALDAGYRRAETLQAIAIYCYFCGNYLKALYWGNKAYHQSLRQQSSYLQVLSMDLMSHSMVHTGKISQGLKFFAETIRVAKLHRYEQIATSIQYSHDSYEILIGKYGAQTQQAIEKVKVYLKIKDAYTHSELALNQARLLLLEGRLDKAEFLLHQSAPAIYGNTNRRQEIHLLIRYIQLALLRGNINLCRQHLRAAQLCLTFVKDQTFKTRVRMMEYKINKLEGNEHDNEVLKLKIIKHFSKSPFLVDWAFTPPEILAWVWRKDFEHPPLFEQLTKLATPKGARQDCRGAVESATGSEVFKEVHKARDYFEHLGYYGVVAELLDMKAAQGLYLLGGSRLLLKEQSLITVSGGRLSPLLRKILGALATHRSMTKAELIEGVWGYDYDPLRHDAIVYVALQNLRKILGPCAKWLETTEGGWRFDSALHIFNLVAPGGEAPGAEGLGGAPSAVVPSRRRLDEEMDAKLNHRQSEALAQIPKSGFWTVPKYKKVFSVSTMTAYRDLKVLVDLKLLLRKGHGRLTTYHVFVA